MSRSSLLFLGGLTLPLLMLARAEGDLTRVFPNGARVGSAITLTFGGSDIPETSTLVVDGDGIRAEGPFTKGVGKITVDAGAAPGVRQLRLVGPAGALNPRPFSLGAFPERDEKEPNSTRDQAERLESLPVVLNGSLPTRPDLDLYRVSLKRGDCLVVAGESRKLGAPTDLVVRVRAADGRELVTQMNHRTRDPLLGFVAPEDGEYLVEFQDVMNNYSGINADYVYRVSLTTGGWIDTVFPAGAQRGATTRFRLTGWNLGGQRGPSTVYVDVAVPADAPEEISVTGGGAGNSVQIPVDGIPNVTEPDRPVTTGATPVVPPPAPEPVRITPPVTVNGEFSQRSEKDVFEFAAKARERLLLQVSSRSLDSFADPILELRDASGKVLATVDDAAGSRDPRLLWTAPADGVYRVHLRDVASGSRGGHGFFYRFSVAPPAPTLLLTTTATSFALKPGEKVEIPVKATAAYLAEAATLQAEGLPEGITSTPVTIPASPAKETATDVKVVLTAKPELKPGHHVVRLRASGGGVSATATAKWVLATDRSGTLAEGVSDRIVLVVPPPAPAAPAKK